MSGAVAPGRDAQPARRAVPAGRVRGRRGRRRDRRRARRRAQPFVPLAAFAGAVVAVTAAFCGRSRGSGSRGDAARAAHGRRGRRCVRERRDHGPPGQRQSERHAGRAVVDDGFGGRRDLVARWDGWLHTSAGGGALLVGWGREIDVLALGEDAAAGLGVGRRSRDTPRVSRGLAPRRGDGRRRRAGGVRGARRAAHRARGWASGPSAASSLGERARRRHARGGGGCRGAHRAPPAELPLGAVTAIIGVPFFLVQLRRLR